MVSAQRHAARDQVPAFLALEGTLKRCRAQRSARRDGAHVLPLERVRKLARLQLRQEREQPLLAERSAEHLVARFLVRGARFREGGRETGAGGHESVEAFALHVEVAFGIQPIAAGLGRDRASAEPGREEAAVRTERSHAELHPPRAGLR